MEIMNHSSCLSNGGQEDNFCVDSEGDNLYKAYLIDGLSNT